MHLQNLFLQENLVFRKKEYSIEDFDICVFTFSTIIQIVSLGVGLNSMISRVEHM